MAATLKANMVIAQSGGPTMVINQSLVGAVLEAKKHPQIRGIYGSLHGIQGLLSGKMVNLRKESAAGLELVAQTPSSALGSVRKKPKDDECKLIFDVLRQHGVGYFFYIGGNDTAETTHIVNEAAREAGYPLRCFHIPKTIDNDLLENDHTPGFGSAARFVAMAMMGDNLDGAALPGVKINVVMGRHAGFLTAASALARVHPDDGPHLVYVPEVPLTIERFVSEVEAVYRKLGRCLVAVSEGVSDDKGQALVARFTQETDSHGNVQLSGTGALGDLLSQAIKSGTTISRVRADTFGYLQRSFPGVVSEVDAREARRVGEEAVRLAASGDLDGSVAIRRKPGRTYRVEYRRVELRSVAKATRHMPKEFLARNRHDITPAFLDYLRPLVGPLPRIGRLKRVAL